MKTTLTLTAVALSLLTTLAYARDNDARDLQRWLQSINQSHSVSDSGGGSSSEHAAVTVTDTTQQTQQWQSHDNRGHR